MPTVFGAPLAMAELADDGTKTLRVPAVLAAMWEVQSSRPVEDGLALEGLFRVPANADEVSAVRAALDAGETRGLLQASR